MALFFRNKQGFNSKVMTISSACLVIVLLGMPALAWAQEQHRHQPDPAECRKLTPDLKAVVTTMEGPGRKVQAQANRAEINPLSPVLERLDVVLHPADQVSLIAAPKSEKKPEGQTFAGLLAFSVPQDGDYRVSSDTALWIDVLDGGKALERTKLNRRMPCGRVHKSLGFSLRAGLTYWLQLSGNQKQEVHVIITSD